MLARRCLRSDAYHHLHFCGSICHMEHAIFPLRRVRVLVRVRASVWVRPGWASMMVEGGRRGQEAEG